jgi:hypothetical protein
VWRLHRPYRNVPGYWVIECEQEGGGDDRH